MHTEAEAYTTPLWLIERHGPRVEAAHMLNTSEITVGRDRQSTVTLNSRLVSLNHARIFWEANRGRYVLEDLGSTNGTYLNGERVTMPCELHDGDSIALKVLPDWSLAFESHAIGSVPEIDTDKTIRGPIEIVSARLREVQVFDQRVSLTPKEFDALQLLLEKLEDGDGVATKDELCEKVWPERGNNRVIIDQEINALLMKLRNALKNEDKDTDTIAGLFNELCISLKDMEDVSDPVSDQNIARLMADLRHKLEVDPEYPRIIQAVYGLGYKLVVP